MTALRDPVEHETVASLIRMDDQMLADDVYRTKLQTTTAGLKQIIASLSDVAEIVVAQSPEHARFSLIPHAIGACPVEILLRADQYYDIALASEFYEDCRIENLGLFEQLIQAVANGDVIQRHYISAATGAERAVESIVTLPGGTVWHKGHVHSRLSGALADGRAVYNDRRFLPYRR